MGRTQAIPINLRQVDHPTSSSRRKPAASRVSRSISEVSMADYFTTTVVQQTIPVADVTPLERLLLSHVFTAEASGGKLYFYAEEGPADTVRIDRTDVETALVRSGYTGDSRAVTHVDGQLSAAEADATEIELEVTTASWEQLLQDAADVAEKQADHQLRQASPRLGRQRLPLRHLRRRRVASVGEQIELECRGLARHGPLPDSGRERTILRSNPGIAVVHPKRALRLATASPMRRARRRQHAAWRRHAKRRRPPD
jgi:hypothetical protein